MYSLQLKDVSLKFGAFTALDNISLDVRKGEFLVLLGPSGCGKSTLLNCIAGLLEVSAGQIFINDRNVTWDEPKDRGIGMVFQSYALYPQMTVKGNLSFGLKSQRLPRDEIEKRVSRATEILQITSLLDRKPAALSGGQRQRVAIGRALVRDVEVFLFDEPLSNLDAKLRSELRVEIKRLHGRLKNTMIHVTHDQIEALTLAHRIVVMRDGVIHQFDTPRVIYQRPANLFVASFIGSPAMNFLPGSIKKTGKLYNFVTEALSLTLEGYVAEGELTPCDDVVFGIRPEHITLAKDAIPGQTIPGVIEIDEPMGADNLLWLNAAGKQVSVRVPAELDFPIGSKWHLHIDVRKASLFDKRKESRI